MTNYYDRESTREYQKKFVAAVAAMRDLEEIAAVKYKEAANDSAHAKMAEYFKELHDKCSEFLDDYDSYYDGECIRKRC